MTTKLAPNPFALVPGRPLVATPATGNVRAAAKELVARARLGDQNAAGMIAAAKEAADKGSPRAQTAVREIRAEIAARPVKDSGPTPIFTESTADEEDAREDEEREDESSVGAEYIEPLRDVDYAGPVLAFPSLIKACLGGQACVMALGLILANGPYLTNERIDNVAAMANGFLGNIFRYSVANYRNEKALTPLQKKYPRVRPVVFAAIAIGYAQHLQLARQPKSLLSTINPIVGWELGE